MSIEAMAIALHHSHAKGTAKLVLLGIANHDGDGGAWPSVATLAKYAGVEPRNVTKAIARLEELREVRRFIQAGGDHRVPEHQRPNRYQVLLQCPADCDRTTRHRTRADSAVELPIAALDAPLTPASPGDGSVTRPLTLASPKPSLNQTTGTKKKSHVSNARNAGACGHPMIDDRHCERGCRVTDTLGANA